MHFWRFVADGTPSLPGTYDWVLVALSVLVASLGAFVALAVVQRVARLRSESTRRGWMVLGACAMGLGVWAMHFTGMLAFALPVPVGYEAVITGLSALPAILGSAFALHIMARRSNEWWRLQLGGLCLAVGIGAMHYLGMEAMRGDMRLAYVPLLFVLSIVVAHTLATASLYLRFAVMKGEEPGLALQSLTAVLMGCAVSGMHYTAMAAARFLPGDGSGTPGLTAPPTVLAGFIVGFVTLFLMLGLIGMSVDGRLAAAEDAARDSASRHAALLDAMADGFVTLTDGGLVESMNPAAEVLFGKEAGELIGTHVAELIPGIAEGGAACDWACRLRELNEVDCLHVDGLIPVELRASSAQVGLDEVTCLALRDISERRKAELALYMLATAVEQSTEAILVFDIEGRVEYLNPAFSRISGYEESEILGQLPDLLRADKTTAEFHAGIWEALRNGEVWHGHATNVRKDGEPYETESTISPVRDAEGNITNYVEVRRDVTEREQLERQLASAQKLESIGQLAAGIAHEINTPTQYVGDNTRFLEDSFGDLLGLIEKLQSVAAAAKNGGVPSEMVDEVETAIERADLEYLIEEIPRAIAQSLEGVERVTKIVRAMKEFSHPSVEKTPTDLNAAMQSTITVATNEWKYVADIETDLDPELPAVPVVPGAFNQVVLNMIVNAAHAISDVVGDGAEGKGRITVTSRAVDRWAEITISDTGKGMPPDVKDRVFDPFFTTKEVGKGTGQGLSIAHDVVVTKHGGTITVDSTPGEGTTFTIRLPLETGAAGEEPESESKAAVA